MEIERDQNILPPVEIPLSSLSDDALEGIIENFILREGTDYGAAEISLEKKKEQIRKQIQKNDVKIVFDHESESVTLMTQNEWRKISSRQS